MKKIIIIVFAFLVGSLVSYSIFRPQVSAPSRVTPGERLQMILEARSLAIEEAVKEGTYKCCIKPPCTMCYLDANQWNNFQPGTCACDNLIAQGKEPCPQCKKSLCTLEEACGGDE